MRLRIYVEQILSLLVLIILLAYSVSTLVAEPYIGFNFNPTNGEILAIFVTTSGADSLRVGDKLEQVGSVTWDLYRADQRQPLFENVSPGQTIEIVVYRDGESESINWVIPGRNTAEVRNRLIDYWWLSYFFWLTGLATVLFIRPVDSRQVLIVIFSYLTALWLMLGALSASHLWHSAILLRSLTWLTVPVYLHLHWVFPKPIKQVPSMRWLPLYVISISLAAAEWFQLLPLNVAYIGLLAALIGSIVLIILHYILEEEQRQDIIILGFFVLLAFLPLILAAIFRLSDAETTLPIVHFTPLGLIGLPIAYFYIAYRHQPGWLEVRTNRIISLFIFLVLVSFINLFPVNLLTRFDLGITSIPVYTLILLANLILAILIFPIFQRLIDRHLFGIRVNKERMAEDFSTRIAASLERDNLIQLIREELIPSFQVKESAFMQLSRGTFGNVLYTDGITLDQIPSQASPEDLLKVNYDYRSEAEENDGWIKFAMPIELNGKRTGIWIFGRRDPDDVYSQTDIKLLTSLGYQIAIALANIEQNEQLRLLYENNIQRHEEERFRVAHALHDDVLNNLATLRLYHGAADDNFQKTYEQLAMHLRNILRGLRPALLEYGLWRAFDELVEELQNRSPNNVSISLGIVKSEYRYPPEIEQHIFRIVQQAVENARQHAQADTIIIHGHLDHDGCTIIVEDDGIGLPNADNLDMLDLLENQHYGLVGMFERAALIGAQLEISAESEKFTRVKLDWHWPADE